MDTKLKPCPFCGSDDVEVIHFSDSEAYAVLCAGCGAEGPWVDARAEGARLLLLAAEASELWNQRPPTEHDQSWLREAVERVLASAPHLFDEQHRRRLAEAAGLEIARAHARARHEIRRQRTPAREKKEPDAVVVEVSVGTDPESGTSWAMGAAKRRS